MPTLDAATLHHQLIRGFLDDGACPTNAELARRFGTSVIEIESQLRALADIHGVVLHPRSPAPWVVHPFSVTPTLNFVETPRAGWWAPCVWCAFGVATLAGGDVTLHTRLGAEAETIAIPVSNGAPAGFHDLVVHFAIPPSRAWNNVHEHCAMVLPFRSEADVASWCGRHHLERGEVVPLPKVAELARRWYGSHADPDWHKWTVPEAQAILRATGLDSAFWALETRSGEF